MKSLIIIALALLPSIGFAGVNKEEIRLKVKEHVQDVSDCYTAALKTDPTLQGKLVVDWDINDKGEVSKAEVNKAKSTLNSEAINDCLIAKLKSWKFAASSSAQTVSVSYPFSFDNK